MASKVPQPAVIFQHRSAPVRLDHPQTPESIIHAQALTIAELQGVVKQLSHVPLHPEPEFHPVEPIHVHALKGELPADACAACGQSRAAHYDSSGCILLGCEFALQHGVQAPGWPLGALYGDPYVPVTNAIRVALRAECGPAVSTFVSTLGWDEFLMLARTLSRIAVSAYLEESAQ